MGYVEDLLASNEQVVYTTRRHWVAPLFATVTGSLLTAGGIAAMLATVAVPDGLLADVLLWGGLAAALIGLTLLAKAFVMWWSEQYIVTNQKVMKVSGILRKTAEGSALEKINDITIAQSLLGRWLGYGTLTVLTAADESNLHYTTMRRPMEFRRSVLDQKQIFEQADARAIAEAVRGAQAGVPHRESAEEIAGAIERLAELRDAGALTQAEFEAKKAELLRRL